MASLQKKGNSWYCQFYWRDRRFTFSIGRVTKPQAEAKATKAGEIVELLERGMLKLPDGVKVADFVKYEGQPPAPVESQKPSQKFTLGTLRDRFIEARRGGREQSTQKTSAIHFKHLVATFGERFPLPELTQGHLQRHIERRAGGGISATTIRKEITTLRTAWHWAAHAGALSGEYPNRGLVYPKEDELPPYQTREEIERQIAAGGLTDDQVDELWEALYLRPHEIAELLEHVRTHARHPWIYPLACLAGHTGARRSELLRIRVADIDFAGEAVTIREKKRVKGKRSTRRAPLTPLLANTLKEWLTMHPGGQPLLCHAGEVARSKKRSPTTGHQNGESRATTAKGRLSSVRRREIPGTEPLTVGECHDHFKRTLAGSKWGVVKGLHTLRHSVASCLAAAGVDQRIIDDMLGHVSEEMKRRYRHLTPELKTQAVAKVFG